MVEEFIEHIKLNKLAENSDKILLAISGGVDSMTMLDLFRHVNYKIAIAHFNFKLRGEESDGDQLFVREYAKKNNIEFITTQFDTGNFAKKNKISIQMAARELRYNWFNEIAQNKGFTKIATAHNLNDVAETFFINLTRSTGLKGLTGIPVINKNIIRPLLFASRKKIIEYATKNNISYREDSTNAETKYLRNAIRHKILSLFEEISPTFLNSLSQTTKLLSAVNNIYTENLNGLKKELLEHYSDEIKINIQKLKNNVQSPEILFDILSEYGFSLDNTDKILKALDNQPGLIFKSPDYILVKDRRYLIIKKHSPEVISEYKIDNEFDTIDLPVKLKIIRLPFTGFENIIRSKQVATFDSEKIQFPLILRKWNKGDYFIPFGMNGRKKISDLFTDLKLSLHEKDKVWLLTSGGNIIWVINHRTDNRFRVTKNTKEIIQIEVNG